MIYFKSFKNYDEFKKLFGIRECGNGSKSRKNKILLGVLKSKELFKLNVKKGVNSRYWYLRNMPSLKDYLVTEIGISTFNEKRQFEAFKFYKAGTFFVENMRVDNGGVCEDGDVNSIRYLNVEKNKVFKMKSGRFLNKIIGGCSFGQILPQQAKSWLGEEFSSDWQAYSKKHQKDTYEFHYGDDMDDFREIYSSENRRGDFHSCMTDEDNYSMYHDAVKCHAAWLTDCEGEMFARCIVFDEVTDETDGGTVLRLAERQYADDIDESLMKLLVNELIERDLIDGYKQIGASCHDNRAFVLNDGTSLSDHRLHIECNLDTDDKVSYMDSFVYYDINSKKAYNYQHEPYSHELDTTSGELEGEVVWSDYNNEYIDADDACWVESHDDYFYPDQVVYTGNGEYELEEDCVKTTYDGVYVLKEDAYQLEDGGCNDFSDYYFADENEADRWLDANDYEWSDYCEYYVNRDYSYYVQIYNKSDGNFYCDVVDSGTCEEWKDEGKIVVANNERYLLDSEEAKLCFEKLYKEECEVEE